MLLSAPSAKKLPGVHFNARAHANKADNSHYPGDSQSTGKRAISEILESKSWNDLCQDCNAHQKKNNTVAYKMLKHAYSLPRFDKSRWFTVLSIGSVPMGVKIG